MVEQSVEQIRQLLADGANLRTGQVAKLFGVNPATVHRWIKAGKIRYRQTPGRFRECHPEDVRRLLAEYEQWTAGGSKPGDEEPEAPPSPPAEPEVP